MLRAVAFLALLAGAAAWWKDEDPRTRGAAPYPYPEDRKYNTKNSKDGQVEGKIKCAACHLLQGTSSQPANQPLTAPCAACAASTWCRTRTTTPAGR